MHSKSVNNYTFIALLIVISIGFGSILWPFVGAVFWALALAILFKPLNKKLQSKLPNKPNLATLCTLMLCLVGVIIPLILVGISVVTEAASIYTRITSGQIQWGQYLQQMQAGIPDWALKALQRLNLASADEIEQRLTSIAGQTTKTLASQILAMGQNTLGFIVSFGVMLYLLFFFLRDGHLLARRVRNAIPMETAHKYALIDKFATVIRATVKGNLVVACAQGALGGIIFWIMDIHGYVLWGVLMAFLSLLPAVGASLIWGPVSIYFIATGSWVQGTVLAVYGILVIGLVDNVLRPILVGKDTKMPDYVVLISTLGGMSLFGISGFVIGPVIAALFIACWEIFSPNTDNSQ